ncbi:MAG TPA: hypothetical protein PL042_01660 [Caldisericia bacterium]|nr:hypothetical protein [Caldisericia bacterium]
MAKQGELFMEMIKEVKDTINENHKEVKVELKEIKDTLKNHQIDYEGFKVNTTNNISNHSQKINCLEKEIENIKSDEINENKAKIKWYKTLTFKIIIGSILLILALIGVIDTSQVIANLIKAII